MYTIDRRFVCTVRCKPTIWSITILVFICTEIYGDADYWI